MFGGGGGGGDQGLEKAKQAQEKHTDQLLAKEDVEGTAVGFDGAGGAAVVIYTARPGLPDELDGVPLVVRVTGKFYALPVPSQTQASFTYACSGLDCDFDASSSKGKGRKSYDWDFGDNTGDAGGTGVNSYAAAGTYTVTLTLTAKDGSDSTSQNVTVEDSAGGGDTDCSATGDTTVRCARPVPIGVSTGHPDITAGTIGARVTDGTDVYALSNNHVYANQNDATIGDAVIQPGTFDGGSSPADDISTLSDFEPMLFNGSNNTMDAAIAVSSTANLWNSTPNDGYGTPTTAPVSASVGQVVKKYGRTTKFTTVTVSEINVTVDVCYEGFPSCTKLARFVDQIAIVDGTFSDGGDSGSLIVDGNDNPVGLLFAGSSTRTLANRIDLVLTRFAVTIDGKAPGSAPPPSSAALSVTVTTDKASYVKGEKALFITNVTDGTDPVPGAAVLSEVTTANGNKLACNGTTNDNGDFIMHVQGQPKPRWGRDLYRQFDGFQEWL